MKLIAYFSLQLAVSTCLCVAQSPPVVTLDIGADAPDFRLPGVDGRLYSLRDFADAKILVVVFTCNHCPTAQYYEERIKQLVVDYRDKGVALVAVSPNDPAAVRLDELGYTDLGDSLEEMQVRAKHRQFNFPYLYGGGQYEPASKAYGPVATPHTFIFDEARRLQYVGRIDDSEREQYVRVRDVRNALDALLAGKEVHVKRNKVFGCSIKWSDKVPSVRSYLARLAAEPVTVETVDTQGLQALRSNQPGPNALSKLRLVNFWATWCGPCVTEFPELITINRMYRHRDFELITVSADDPDDIQQVKAFLHKHQASGRNLLFAERNKYPLIEAFDPEWSGALPYSVLIDPAGQVLFRHQGAVDPLELRRLIVRTLNAKKPW